MKCDFCSNDANLEIVVFVNGKPQKLHLCSSCYEEKLQEMAEMMPEEWGGQALSEQIRSLLERAKNEGGSISSMEFSVINPEEIDDENNLEEADELEEGGEPVKNVFNPFSFLTNKVKKNEEEEKASARELAFSRQRKSLLKSRAKLLEQMREALIEENYEQCAIYRDQLDQIGESLLLLNEERKDPHGV